ncbi:hypothetical protein SAMN04488542_103169 [Fontibacillus panacisegetis]|uniref:ABC-2 family transporter protein n=1 Tax=Fontibacillus panacisegetis TaxID=670482 RepID=A0A1G7GRL0_9BACL|nr:hypothetical protein [Fontibacillus panacisegetis]SDE90785.1 hypothetical protein SAMN04488542_103169 [Fontibacillus panacisegetis]
MTSWITLFYKEFRASKMWIYFNILLILIGAAVFFFIDETQIVLYSLLVMILFHVIYLPVWVIYSIFTEWKNRTLVHWFNLPHSGFVLLTAKYVAGIVMMIVSLIVCNSLLVLLYSSILDTSNELVIQASDWFVTHFWSIFVGTMIMAIFSGTQVVCAIIIAKSATRFGLIFVAIFLLLPTLFQILFHDTIGYTKLVSWGMTTSASAEWLHPLLLNQHETLPAINVLSELTIFSLGIMLPQLVYSILLIWISSKLLDKAVQV